MTAILLPSGRLRYHAYIDGAYGPAVGYKLWTYEAGTTTPKATYDDSDGATPLANPIVLDANGECAPYGTGAYKLVLTDPDDAVVWTQDNVILSLDSVNAEWCSTGGTADAVALTPANAITAYQAGQSFQFIPSGANTGAVTVEVSGLAAKPLTKNGSTALVAGDLVSGKVTAIQYDGVRFQLLADPLNTITLAYQAADTALSATITAAYLAAISAAQAYLEFRDEKASNTDGGTFTSGAWRTRTLNTEAVDTNNHGSLSSNQITLAAGTYVCEIRVPAYAVGRHQARLRNMTDTATTLVGSSASTSSTATVTTDSIITGRFTIADSKTFEVQHQCASTQATVGFGLASNWGEIEIYTVARFWKVA